MITRNLPVVYWFQSQGLPNSEAVLKHQQAIEKAGFYISKVTNLNDFYQHALSVIISSQPAVFMVWGLGNDSLAALARWRTQRSGLPIVVIFPNYDEASILQGLYCGADDFCLECYGSDLWIAKIESLLRRKASRELSPTAALVAPSPELPTMKAEAPWQLIEGGWVLLSPGGISIELTTTERILFLTLGQQDDRRAPHQLLLDAISDGDESQETPVAHNRLGVVISRLKRKGQEHGVSIPIRSVYKWGYMFGTDIQIV